MQRAVLVVLLVPALAGCALLGPGEFYDVRVETEAVGHVVAPGTPASNAEIFLALTDAAASEPVPPDRTHEAGETAPGSVLELSGNRSKAIHRLPLDARGDVAVRVPVDHDVDVTIRIVESAPPFHVSEQECPTPQRLRSTLRNLHLTADTTVVLEYFVSCGGSG